MANQLLGYKSYDNNHIQNILKLFEKILKEKHKPAGLGKTYTWAPSFCCPKIFSKLQQ